VDPAAVLDAFDQQVRRHQDPTPLDGIVERDELVVRCVSAGAGWNGLTWSDLDAGNADRVIAAQLDRFAEVGREWEWKHYSHDQPADLPHRLVEAGFTAQEPEALMVAAIADLDTEVPAPPGVELVSIDDRAGVDRLLAVGREVFGSDHGSLGQALLGRLHADPPAVAALIAMAGDTPIAGGRVEFYFGTDFAGLWGGGTLVPWRGRGVFRSLVSRRAALAAANGFRFLQVDASSQSRPILERLGFVQLAVTTPFVHPGHRVADDSS
jgi:hypothetical protein